MWNHSNNTSHSRRSSVVVHSLVSPGSVEFSGFLAELHGLATLDHMLWEMLWTMWILDGAVPKSRGFPQDVDQVGGNYTRVTRPVDPLGWVSGAGSR